MVLAMMGCIFEGNTSEYHNPCASVRLRRVAVAYAGSRTERATDKTLAIWIGSSPLSRGTRVVTSNRKCLIRFIPALAGNTCSPASTRNGWTVHPRSRGEHGQRPAVLPAIQRFIPALAGNTRFGSPRFGRRSVHPRSRGEHVEAFAGGAALFGSSPLSRGTRGHIPEGHAHVRFIPALAGNTEPVAIVTSVPAVHPRSRGEHACVTKAGEYFNGSSPLSRGTRSHFSGTSGFHRFIPALAGNTACR